MQPEAVFFNFISGINMKQAQAKKVATSTGAIKESWIEEAAYEAHRLAATTHPVDVRQALNRSFQRETKDLPKFVMKSILENSSVAEEDQRPFARMSVCFAFMSLWEMKP
jgi:hypothetical protein